MRPIMPALLGLAILAPAVGSAWAVDLARGKKLYQDNCAGCHGDTGRPVMVNTPDFTRGEGLQMSDSELVDSIEVGKRQMPGFEGLLSREELSDIVIYLRTLWF